MGSTVFRILQTLQNPQASPSGFYISVFSILNPVDPLASVSNLYLERLKDKTAEFTLPLMCPLFGGSSVRDVGGMRNAWLL